MTARPVLRWCTGLLLAACAVVALVAAWHWQEGYRLYVVRTGSMAPAHQPGDLLVNRPAEALTPGDVLTFRTSTGLVTHRLVEVTAGGLVVKGDANRSPDALPIAPADVVGVVQVGVPNVGYVLQYLSQPAGAASAMTSVLAVGLAWTLFFPSTRPAAPSGQPARLVWRRSDVVPALIAMTAVVVLAISVTTVVRGIPATDAYVTDSVDGANTGKIDCECPER